MPDAHAPRATRARGRRPGRSAEASRGGAAALSPPSELWRRWALGILIVTALVVPLIFDLLDRDAFARAKLAALHLLVPLAATGPLLGLLTGRLSWGVKPRRADVAVGVFVVLAVLATIFSIAPEHSLEGEHFQWQGLVSLLLYAIAYGVARAVLADEPAVRWFFGALAVAVAIIAGYGLLQQVRLDPVWGVLDKGRIFSTLGQANTLGAFFVLTVPCVAALVVVGGRILRPLAAATLVLALGALALTLSRGGYLGLLAGLAAMIIVVAPSLRLNPRWIRTGVLVSAAAVAIVLVLPPTRQEAVRVLQRGASIVTGRDSSTASHLDLWAVAIRVTIDHPALGTGPDTYALEFPRYRNTVLPPERAAVLEKFRPESPHDVYLAISSGLGLPALAAYLALIALALARAVRSARATSGGIRVLAVALIGAIVGHVVSDAFMTAELTGSWLFWTLIGAAVSLPGRSSVVVVDAREEDGNDERSGRARTSRAR